MTQQHGAYIIQALSEHLIYCLLGFPEVSLAALLGGTLEEIYMAEEKGSFLLIAAFFPHTVKNLRGISDVHLSVVLFIPLILMKHCRSALSEQKELSGIRTAFGSPLCA